MKSAPAFVEADVSLGTVRFLRVLLPSAFSPLHTDVNTDLTVCLQRHTIKPGLAPLAWPGPKVGLASILASILASTQILAWPQKLAWPQIWPLKIFLASFFFQNSDLFRDVLIMISMIDSLSV